MVPDSSLISRLAHLLLAATIVVPACSFAWGHRDGVLAFVLYREPKLVAIVLLGSLLLLAIAGIGHGRLLTREALVAAFDRPIMLFLAFAGWTALSAAWATVSANARYELRQLAILVPLTIALLAWSRSDAAVPRRACWYLVVALGVATAMGGLQSVGALPWLVPIDPLNQVAHPSVMGYKNPMALALVGQLFLLAGLARTVGRGWLQVFLVVLWVAEVIYLLTLESRTAYFALAGGLLTVGGVELALRLGRSAPNTSSRPARIAVPVVATAVASVAIATMMVAVMASPDVRARLGSAAAYVRAPATYLESDRGIYLRNTLHMVRQHPFGVGLGDWQTQYPVFRAVERHRWFDAAVQVRRAHSDHVQILGETGWLGLGLWLALWLAVLVRCARATWRCRDPGAGYLLAQSIVLVIAMASDYFFELPYGKLNVFLIWFLAFALPTRPPAADPSTCTPCSPGKPAPSGDSTAMEARERGATYRVVIAVLIIHALSGCLYAWSLGRSIHAAASFEERYAAWHRASFLSETDQAARRPLTPAALTELAMVSTRGEQLLQFPDHTKTHFRSHQQAAQAALLLGRDNLASMHVQRALALHPYHPGLLELMAVIHERRGSEHAASWREAARYVTDQATAGFERPYPRLDR